MGRSIGGLYGCRRNDDCYYRKKYDDRYYNHESSNRYEDKILKTYENMKIELEIQNDWYWSCRARSYFMELIIILERLYGMLLRGELAVNEGNNINTQNERVNKALFFIESHYNESIILKDILIFCKTNHTTLGESFLREVGQTPIEYLWSYRIKISKKMLAFTEIPLKDISGRCGFKTVSHFSRVFKEQTGKTPAQFRKTALDERLSYMKNK